MEWLAYAPAESLSLFMFQKPRTAKRLHFDVIPKAVDEYHQHLRGYSDQELKAQLNNPVWHIHGGHPPASNLVVPFAMLLNLASVAGAEDAGSLWGFIQRYAPDASPETHPDLDAAAGYAVRYYNDEVKPKKVYRAATDVEAAAMSDLAERLKAWEGGLDAEALQSEVFAVSKAMGLIPYAIGSRRFIRCCLGLIRARALAASSRFTVSTRRFPFWKRVLRVHW